MQSIRDFTRSAGFIFSGTVMKTGDSTVPDIPPGDNVAVVRIDRPLRVNPVLGDLSGKLITVAMATPGSLQPGQKAVFFTNSWVHGRGIAVREVSHVNISEEDAVAATVTQLPEMHLQERLQSAKLVVNAEVTRIRPVERTTFERNAALWEAADLKIEQVLRGKAGKSTVVYFPTSDHPMWARAPRFQQGQRGIFILHAPDRNASPSEGSLGKDSLVALDSADYQPESHRQEVEKLLGKND